MQTVTWLVAPVWDIAETTAVTAALLRNSGDFRYVSRHTRCRLLCPDPSTGSREPRALPAAAVGRSGVKPLQHEGLRSISKIVCLKGGVRTLC